jgi:transposase
MEIEFRLETEALPDQPTDLSGVVFNEKQRAWIIYQILSKQETATTIARKYSLSRNTVKDIVRRYKLGCVVGSGPGKPRAIDNEGISSAQNIIRKEATTNIIDDSDIESILTEEYIQTNYRRHPELFPEGMDDIIASTFSKTTKWRYRKKMEKFIEENGFFVDEIPDA